MADRRRANGPAGGTSAPIFVVSQENAPFPLSRTRRPNELRKIFLRTGTVPSAAGSAYLELETPAPSRSDNVLLRQSTLKLSCTVHGPKPVARAASFSPNLQLSAHVKVAPFATQVRRGYIRDSEERDIGVHLETALKAVILADRYPKSAVEVIVTVLEAEEDAIAHQDGRGLKGCGAMNLLAGCITVASAALADAKIDCVDLMVGGVAAAARGKPDYLLDPAPVEHDELTAVCAVGYLPSRDEVTALWMKGDLPAKAGEGIPGVDAIMDAAVSSAKGLYSILQQVVIEAAEQHALNASRASLIKDVKGASNDTEMKT